MTRKMYFAQLEVSREMTRRSHRTKSDFQRRDKIVENYKKFLHDYYSGARGVNKKCPPNWP